MIPSLEYMREEDKEEIRKENQKEEIKEFKNKIGKQRRNCWWN